MIQGSLDRKEGRGRQGRQRRGPGEGLARARIWRGRQGGWTGWRGVGRGTWQREGETGREQQGGWQVG